MEFPDIQEKEQLDQDESDQDNELIMEFVNKILEAVRDSPRAVRKLKNGRLQEVIFSIHMEDGKYTLLRSFNQIKTSTLQLSPREQEIVRLVSKGYPNKTLALFSKLAHGRLPHTCVGYSRS
jgi:DNA-binding NarL/FixJ family response regulator